ncbi:MAG: pentapeptide repeat-containing protein [Methylococcales bacterium]|nr:pentapeptide repeat-containing protein [Methylococcales bacterium]
MSIYDQLQKQLTLCESLTFSFSFIDQQSHLIIQCYTPSRHSQKPAVYTYLNHSTPTIQEILHVVTNEHKASQPDLLSLSIQASTSKNKADIKALVMEAICEAFNIYCPDAKNLNAMKKEKKAKQQTTRDAHIALLKQSDIKAFNTLTKDEKDHAAHYRKIDLSAAKISEVSLIELNFQSSLFDGTDLSKAKLCRGQFKAASFKNAVMDHSDCSAIKAMQADFSGAKMEQVNLSKAILKEAKFNKAVLNNANLTHCNLLGTDFRHAKMKGANLQFSSYDNNTLFPDDFIPHPNMVWKGTGPSPSMTKRRATRDKKTKTINIKDFMTSLDKSVESSRLNKALKMLKKSSFKLYTQLSDSGVTGVIKSQSDPSLVYACQLNSEGQFCCCTQNLNPCGGLRGKLCKHLLVLVVGLAQDQEVDIKTIFQWVDNSRDCNPKLDQEMMSEVLLRYKGAETGTIDWRPTETVPEDYYLF